MVERDAYSDLVFWEDLDPDAEEGDLQALKEMIEQLFLCASKRSWTLWSFFWKRMQRGPERKPGIDWGGALRDLRDRYTSLKLQHETAR
ncbi:MAG: hypothetical protein QHG98_01550 [Methanothrix sp.]|jgi:hypothetical protein|uniref:hypothetical protein n=1 Tax=Methanothrix sp. TaxID=90426 RepID=UPI00247BF510|nr:hypothetical protein [Methanothrix sp.]